MSTTGLSTFLLSSYSISFLLLSVTARECKAPATPLNAYVSRGTGRVVGRGYDTSYEPGGNIEYSCSRGYVFSSGTTKIRCRADGTWSGSPPTCKWTRICEKPSTPDNAYISQRSVYTTQVSAGDFYTYGCLSGYVMKGAPTIRCLRTGGWTANPPQCVKRYSFQA